MISSSSSQKKKKNSYVPVSLVQLVWTMFNICKVRGSNSNDYKKNDKFLFVGELMKFKPTLQHLSNSYVFLLLD